MPEAERRYFYSHKAVVEELIKRQDLHEGHWMITIEIGLKGTNLPMKVAGGESVLTPAGIVHIFRIGITRTQEPNELSVDASEVNPRKKSPRKRTRKKEL